MGFPKIKRPMRCGMSKPHISKVRLYAAHLIDITYYFSTSPGSKESDEIGETELNEILFNSIPNGRSKQAYVQVFDCETIT